MSNVHCCHLQASNHHDYGNLSQLFRSLALIEHLGVDGLNPNKTISESTWELLNFEGWPESAPEGAVLATPVAVMLIRSQVFFTLDCFSQYICQKCSVAKFLIDY